MWKTAAVVWSLTGLFTLGCSAPTSVGIRSLAADGANNELALSERYEGKELRVTGKVVTIGQAKREVVDVEYSGSSATGRKSYELKPYVALSPDDGEGGVMLLCFFDLDQRGELAELERGQLVTFDGTYGAYGRTKRVPVLRLYDCSIAD
jgi:hypothetical protein